MATRRAGSTAIGKRTKWVAPSVRRQASWLLGIFALGLLGAIGATAALLPGMRSALGPTSTTVGGPFRLQASTGGALNAHDLTGRPYLMFFGFTRCPSVCPTALADLTGLIDDLHGAGTDIRAYFVSVDPERDTPEVLRDYLGSFSDRITGLTGTPKAVARLVRSYHAVVRRVATTEGDYTFDHTALVYLMDARGRFVTAFDPGGDRAQVLARIRRTLAVGA